MARKSISRLEKGRRQWAEGRSEKKLSLFFGMLLTTFVMDGLKPEGNMPFRCWASVFWQQIFLFFQMEMVDFGVISPLCYVNC
jgi:hypothetical protein